MRSYKPVSYTHLLRSFGVPYTEPLIPVVAQEHKDTVVRVPWWAMDKRPRFAGGKDDQRSAPGQMPEAPPPDEKEINHLEGAGKTDASN